MHTVCIHQSVSILYSSGYISLHLYTCSFAPPPRPTIVASAAPAGNAAAAAASVPPVPPTSIPFSPPALPVSTPSSTALVTGAAGTLAAAPASTVPSSSAPSSWLHSLLTSRPIRYSLVLLSLIALYLLYRRYIRPNRIQTTAEAHTHAECAYCAHLSAQHSRFQSYLSLFRTRFDGLRAYVPTYQHMLTEIEEMPKGQEEMAIKIVFGEMAYMLLLLMICAYPYANLSLFCSAR